MDVGGTDGDGIFEGGIFGSGIFGGPMAGQGKSLEIRTNITLASAPSNEQ